MTTNNFKCNKNKAKAYRRFNKEVLRAANAIDIPEDEICCKYLMGESQTYVSNYRLERALHAQKEMEKAEKF